MTCGPGADQFIESHFKDCVYNVRDYIGFCLGLAAIAFWIVAQLPQYYRNYKTKSAEALSPWFLAQWLLGDTFNLIGALLQGQQLPTTVYTAMYFVIADMFMMMQFIYYGALQRRREQVLKLQARRRHHHRRHHHHRHGSSREREALTGQQPHSTGSAGAADSEQPRQPQEQQQGQSSAWPSQQERRRVPHQTVDAVSGQQCQMGPADSDAAQVANSKQQAELQGCLQAAGLTDSRADADDCGSCSDSACSSCSEHSSSKGQKPVSRNSSPSKTCCGAAGGAGGFSGTQSCAAAASATAGPHLRSLPGVRLPFGDVHWGGIRSVVAVAVLVSMGLISLLPASSTRGFAPVSLSGSSAVVRMPAGDSTTARAMQAGLQQQQQGGSIHLQTPLLLDSPAAASSSSSTSSSSSSSSSESSSKGWARQRRVEGEEPQHDWSFFVGTGLGYVASILYLCSRISQIHKNYTRKSSEGLALVMFMMAVCANMCTGTGIVLRTFTLVELKEQLPWIIGSLGTISLDMVILWQSTMYSKHAPQQQPGVVDGVPVHMRHHHHHRHHREGVERQGLLQSGQQHTAVDMAGGLRGQGAGAGLSGNAAVVDGMPLPPHHRGALIDRRHAAAAAAGDLAGDGVEVVLPLVGASSVKL